MYLEKHNHIGEHSSVSEEILDDIPELEQRFRAVEKAVKGGYFSFSEALSVYGVSEIEYISCLFLKNNQKLEKVSKQEQVFETIAVILSIFDQPNNLFDSKGKDAINKLREITKKAVIDQKSLLEMASF